MKFKVVNTTSESDRYPFRTRISISIRMTSLSLKRFKTFSSTRQHGILTTMLTTATRSSCETLTIKENVNEWYAPSLCTGPVPPKYPPYTPKQKACLEQQFKKKFYRFRSSWVGIGLRDVDPRLLANRPLQLPVWFVLRGRVGVGETIPCSKSSSSMLLSIGSAEVEELLTVSAAWAWMSSSLSSWYGSYRGLDGEPRARERTTSPLQIGQVRRRVVNHGVLYQISMVRQLVVVIQLTCNQHGIHDHKADSLLD
jgi:hypothetical protein